VKLDAYRKRVRVPVVWIVDHKPREVHVPEDGRAPHVERATLEWHAPGAPEPLRIDLPSLFREALGEPG